MNQYNIDLGGNDLVWRNKPDLPPANKENRTLEEMLKQKKIEIERLKLVLDGNINKGKAMKEHFNSLSQTLNYKKQLYQSKEHELEMEVHARKLIERESSRLEQQTKALNQEIKALTERAKRRKAAIAEKTEKSEKLQSEIRMDESKLLHYLEKSAQMERDNNELFKYASEDDSKINELGLCIEKLNKECHDRKNALDDADTEVFIVQSELDKMQEEFRNAYIDRRNLIANWEKVMNQVNQRTAEVKKLSDLREKMQDTEKKLKQEEKEQLQLLASETDRNNQLESEINAKEKVAARLRNAIKDALTREEDLNAELETNKNVSANLLNQKQVLENTLVQLGKQLEQKLQKIEDVRNANNKLEKDIEILNKETFEAEHYTKELDKILQQENQRNLEIQNEVETLTKECLFHNHEVKKLQEQEKFLENQTKNCQAFIRNINTKVIEVDKLRVKQESEMYHLESDFLKLQRRVKRMSGFTNEEEKRRVEVQRSHLLSVLDEKKKSLTMMTEELKIMKDKITHSSKELEARKHMNLELREQMKSLEYYTSSSQKTLRFTIAEKQELLVQECFLKFNMKRYKKLLSNRNRTVFNLQKSKAEFEAMVKERTVELKKCTAFLEADMREEEKECSLVKRKLLESEDKLQKLQHRYKTIMDALGISEPGENVEAEMIIKAEQERSDLLSERDELTSCVWKLKEELTALKNILWMTNVANEQFRQLIYPAGISLEDSEALRKTEEEVHALVLKLHLHRNELKTVEESIQKKKQKLDQIQSSRTELEDIQRDRVTEYEIALKEIEEIGPKIVRADKLNSRLSLELKKREDYPGLEEDVRIHLLREIRRTVSELLFAAAESNSEITAKYEELFNQAEIPLPARTGLSRRSSLLSSSPRSRSSSRHSTPQYNSGSQSSTPSSSRASSRSASVTRLVAFPSGDSHTEGRA